MPVIIDFSVPVGRDATIAVSLEPPVAVGGWEVRFQVSKRPGGSGLVQRSVSSGRNGASGLTVVSSGNGTFSVELRANDTSGWDPLNYAYTLERLDSGYRTLLTAGNLTLTP